LRIAIAKYQITEYQNNKITNKTMAKLTAKYLLRILNIEKMAVKVE